MANVIRMDNKTDCQYGGKAENDDLVCCACQGCCWLSLVCIHDDSDVVLILGVRNLVMVLLRNKLLLRLYDPIN